MLSTVVARALPAPSHNLTEQGAVQVETLQGRVNVLVSESRRLQTVIANLQRENRELERQNRQKDAELAQKEQVSAGSPMDHFQYWNVAQALVVLSSKQANKFILNSSTTRILATNAQKTEFKHGALCCTGQGSAEKPGAYSAGSHSRAGDAASRPGTADGNAGRASRKITSFIAGGRDLLIRFHLVNSIGEELTVVSFSQAFKQLFGPVHWKMETATTTTSTTTTADSPSESET